MNDAFKQSLLRPNNYLALTPAEQKSIDVGLGLINWRPDLDTYERFKQDAHYIEYETETSQDIQQICTGLYWPFKCSEFDLKLCVPNIYGVDDVLKSKMRNTTPASLNIVSTDSVDSALNIRSATPGVLIFGSSRRAGGGWDSPVMAQEEVVSRQSSWAIQAQQAIEYYKHGRASDAYNTDLILVQSGWIFKNANMEWLDAPRKVVFYGFAAPNLNGLSKQYKHIDSKKIEQKLYVRCKAFLRLANHLKTPVVLGPIGCGVFKLDPIMVSRTWFKCIQEEGLPDGSVFSIMGGNKNPLWTAFQGLNLQYSTSSSFGR